MDLFSLLRTLGALGFVLGMLAGALWIVREYDIRLPGRVSNSRRRRVELVERLNIDAKHVLALVRRDGCEHLILIGPEGQATIESGIPSAVFDPAPEPVASGRQVPDLHSAYREGPVGAAIARLRERQHG